MTVWSAVGGRTMIRAGRSVVAGVLGMAALLALYVGVISVAQGPTHAVGQLRTDLLFVLPITLGFGIQVALCTELRGLNRSHRAGAAVTIAEAGTNTAAMLACCAHHVVELLPLVGLSAAVVFLNKFKTPLLVLGLGMNAFAMVVVGRRLRRARRAGSAAGAGA